MHRNKQFRDFLLSDNLVFLMEAHDALSAKIAQVSGFQALWASGLTISASLGLRDCSEISVTETLNVVESMADVTTIPIMLDGDTGYGNFNNVRLLVKKLIKRGISAVCLEDKIFPKKNSFIENMQTLEDVDTFCGKIKAGKDSQTDDNFSIVARTEALIAGRSISEALDRSYAYINAGADAILIHSRQTTADEILSFLKQWKNYAPVVLIPTKYYKTPMNVFEQEKVSMIIWANHSLRAAIVAMQNVCRKILKDRSVENVEKGIASLDEIFQLVDQNELSQAEKKYFTKRRKND